MWISQQRIAVAVQVDRFDGLIRAEVEVSAVGADSHVVFPEGAHVVAAWLSLRTARSIEIENVDVRAAVGGFASQVEVIPVDRKRSEKILRITDAVGPRAAD